MSFTRSILRSIRIFLVITLSTTLFLGIPSAAHAVADGTVNCGTSGTFTIASNVVTGHSSCVGTVAIPEGVTGIAQNAFMYAGVTTMTIPASVTTITNMPFNCYGRSLISITVDVTNPNFSSTDGVLFDKLQEELLVYPASKTGVAYLIPATVLTLRSCSFAGNKFLTSVDLPNTLVTMGVNAFLDAESLQTVTVGTGLSTWGAQSFTRNYRLTSFTIDPSNASFTSTDGIAYNKAKTRLVAYPIGKTSTSYTSPTSAITAEQALFESSVNLLTADLSSVATLDPQAFRGSAIKEVILGNALTSIPEQTFQNASVLERVTFGTGLTSIAGSGFFNNFKLNCIVYPGSNATIQNFTYPNSVVPVANSSLCPKSPAFTLSASSGTVVAGTAITSYTIDASAGGAVTSYAISPAISNGTLSFSTSTGLLSGTPSTAAGATTYTITAHNATAPNATRTYALTINPAAYSSGTGAVDCGTSGYFSVSSNVVTGNSSCAGTAVIPSGVTNIVAEAFTANALVTSVYIPNTVLTIGQAAFYADTSLATVTFQANSSLTTIGNSVFERTAVTTIALPNSITSLGNYAFYNVTSLVSITLPNAITNIFEHTFDGCSSLASITIPNTIESFGMDSFKNTTSLASVTYHGPASYASLTAVGINTAALTIAPITTTNVVITAPVTSATPVSSLSSNGQFTSSIAWSGSPTTFAGATTYTATITLTPVNSYTLADVNANFFTINGSPATSGNLINTGVFTYRFPATVAIVPPVVYVAPAPVPYLKTLISPRIEMEPTQLLCWAGRYNFGYTLDGVIQGSSTSYFKPPYPYLFNLIINGVLQSLPPKANRQLVAVWDITSAPSGSVVSCSVTVKVNDLINTDKSTDNTTGLQGARTIQSQAIALANNIYMVMNLVNSNVYNDALDKNRADWRASANSIPAAYHAELAHIKTLPPTKETRALATALRKKYIAALKKNSADYKASGPDALAAKNAANKAALDEMNTAITKANAAYGTFIESIGYGVLIP